MIHSSEHLIDLIEKTIQNTDFNKQPHTLFKPIEYILSLGGKRIRPLLTLMANNLYTDNVEYALSSAIGIEIFHNFTLLHDDLMDKSDMRRGKLTVHKKWDANTAILSGDAMLIEAYKELTKADAKVLPEVLDLFNQTSTEVCQGQQYDMDFESRTDVSVDEYIEMIRLKTAVLVGCSLKMGALHAKATNEDANNLYDFGINIGLAFQLKDDLLDVFGDTAKFGKKIGGDILNNKKTYLLIKALEISNDTQKEALIEWIEKEEYDNDEKIKAIKNIYTELNIKSITENIINKYYIAALKSIEAVNVEEKRKRNIIELAESLMHREH